MSEPQPASLDEVWTALEPHIEWSQGLTLILLFASHPQPVDELRRRAQVLLGGDEQRAVHTIIPRSTEELTGVLPSILVPLGEDLRAVWIELWRGSGATGWDARVGEVLQQLNERRSALEQSVHRPLVLVLPTAMRGRVYVLAPDLWTIRSFTAELASPRAITRSLTPSALPAPAIFALPPPSAEEKEWARLLGLGQHSRIDPWDGIRASEAAMRRGSLASARRIALQVIALIVDGEVSEHAGAMTTDEVLRALSRTKSSGRELLAAVNALGDVELFTGNPSAARSLFQHCLDLAQQFVASRPDDAQAQRDLSVALDKLGIAELDAGNLSPARELFQRSLELREQTASADPLASASPHDAQVQRDLSLALTDLGIVELALENLTQARMYLERALQIQQNLAHADQHSTLVRLDLVNTHLRMAELGERQANLALQREHLAAAENLLASLDPLASDRARQLAERIQQARARLREP